MVEKVRPFCLEVKQIIGKSDDSGLLLSFFMDVVTTQSLKSSVAWSRISSTDSEHSG